VPTNQDVLCVDPKASQSEFETVVYYLKKKMGERRRGLIN
jgi:hypothetical protein